MTNLIGRTNRTVRLIVRDLEEAVSPVIRSATKAEWTQRGLSRMLTTQANKIFRDLYAEQTFASLTVTTTRMKLSMLDGILIGLMVVRRIPYVVIRFQ